MVIKTRLPLLLIFSLFLLSASLAYGDESDPPELQQCRQQCRSQLPSRHQQDCERRCEEYYRERGGEQDVLDELNSEARHDPEREFQRCQQKCSRHQEGQKQQRCQQQCEERYREHHQGGHSDDLLNTREPEREFQQCQQMCQQQHGQQQQQCQRRCEEQYREQQQEGRGGDLLKTRDPQTEFQQCQQRCQQRQGQQQQQQQCQRRCEEQYREQQQEGRGEDLLNTRDPQREFQQCQQRCQQQQGQQQQQCQRRCEDQFREQQQEGRGGDLLNTRDPQREFQQCQQRCQQQQGQQQQQQQCQQRCEEQYREQQQGGRSGDHVNTWESQDPQRGFQQCQQQCRQRQQGREQQRRCEERCEEQQSEQGQEYGYEGESQWQGGEEEENPYLFRQERFRTHIRGQEGRIRVLEQFTRRSELLRGIENYRVAILEANPNTFIVPNHWDADTVCFIAKGRGAITLIQAENNKQTHNLERGDIIRVRAGTTVHIVNRDNNEKLFVVKLVQPVSIPGQFEAFFGPGVRDQDSFFNAFSDEILEAAFNTRSDQLRRLFEGHREQGAFVRASQEQVRALSGRSSQHGQWPFHRGGQSQSERPYNLFNRRPSRSNQFGQLFEANPEDYSQLQDLDVAVSYANISQGSMIAPFYNSRSTKIAMVIRGSGYFEMACPHLSQQRGSSPRRGQEGSGSTSYAKVSARISHGDVYVVPAGHPIVTVASENQNLEVVCFDINAQDNQKNPLAGNNNIFRQLEREAKELSFNVSARQVDEVFNKQQEEWFLPGPQKRQQHASA
ncbi:hypothetical protein IFM89_013760 [Coptis chinensis]|uniref:Cupin type-1 domain-containing protein n=1 Tax=Coptis chinensis TaxID=261450 RepID=A0A835HQG1_9MAGN|nr:hypothetical protein IFM89_013760 [Coptis chinensis]